jgi:hypothetical protein
MGFRDFGPVETAGRQQLERAEVVQVDGAVNLRRVKLRARFPEQRRLL